MEFLNYFKLYAQAALYSYDKDIVFFDGFVKRYFNNCPDWFSVYDNDQLGYSIIAIRGSTNLEDWIQNFDPTSQLFNIRIKIAIDLVKSLWKQKMYLYEIVGHSSGGYIAQHVAKIRKMGGATFCSIPMGRVDPIAILNPIRCVINIVETLKYNPRRVLGSHDTFTNYMIEGEALWNIFCKGSLGIYYGDVITLRGWCDDAKRLHNMDKIVELYTDYYNFLPIYFLKIHFRQDDDKS